MIRWSVCDTILGKLFLASSTRGVCRLSFLEELEPELDWLKTRFPGEEIVREPAGCGRLHRVEAEVHEYLSGRRRTFNVALDLKGTPFQLAVWQELLKVQYGETVTYGELAARLGRPRAARAVGRALHLNPVALIVPCHRVLGAHGALVGYAGGQERKRFLLELERA
ncbi:MAG: methylated-DNA-[protein]-cysteine S-methyltransferase [Bacillota bacterium]|jgi:O-6-methylguanine DNA methyltransferase|nr:methylated-DNA-[protein]-cysteine S-methyltransferase [Bacillota bacterium]MDK2926250.1 methylated-DNA-[protein]-cysteine S-methyltransferase [Bacillota bacterium]MDK2959901.1 methylated-DNA-[protein]-cysteine S-methyltransferase [Bacillota bacterium]